MVTFQIERDILKLEERDLPLITEYEYNHNRYLNLVYNKMNMTERTDPLQVTKSW